MELPPPLPSPERPPWIIWLAGNLAMNVAMAAICGVAIALDSVNHAISSVTYPSLLLLPLLGGLVAAFCWRSLQPKIGQVALQTLFATLVGLFGAVIAFHEGAFCLLLVSPFFYGLVLSGALLGRLWFRQDSSKLRLCVLPLLAVLAAGEPSLRTDAEATLSDEIVIRASPERAHWRPGALLSACR